MQLLLESNEAQFGSPPAPTGPTAPDELLLNEEEEKVDDDEDDD
jgi:hypothetical protein